MKKGSTIIEIREKNKNLNPYFMLSNILSMNYKYFWVKKKNFFSISTHDNYNININEFMKKFF